MFLSLVNTVRILYNTEKEVITRKVSEARKRTPKIRRISILKKVARNADEGHIRKKQNILTRKKGENNY